jgi:hypothetical protein
VYGASYKGLFAKWILQEAAIHHGACQVSREVALWVPFGAVIKLRGSISSSDGAKTPETLETPALARKTSANKEYSCATDEGGIRTLKNVNELNVYFLDHK